MAMMTKRFIFPFLWFLFLGALISPGCGQCIPSERDALLNLKRDLTDPSKRLASWVGGGDCCRWYGVICHNLTGRVLELHLGSLSQNEYYASVGTTGWDEYQENSTFGGRINPSLLKLKHLKYLDLRNNNFQGIPFPEFFGSMESLTHLDLSNVGFGGMIPPQLGNISSLQYLNLYSLYYKPYVENLHWLSGLSSLEFLDMTFVDLSLAFDWLNVTNTLPSLRELHFSFCDLPKVPPILHVNFSSLSVLDLSGNFFPGPIFDFVQNITSLKLLDLSSNNFSSPIPNWFYGLGRLEHVNLRGSELQGEISIDIGNLTSLGSLDLGINQLEGRVPESFKNLCKLKSLSLWEAKLSQDINDILDLLFSCGPDELEELRLSGCQLYGHLPNYLGQFKNMSRLDLSTNFISGSIPVSIGDLKPMKDLDLSQNNLNGTLPSSFGELTELETLDLSYNSLEGDVSEIHFQNLSKLTTFLASGNQLRLRVSPNWNPPPQLRSIDMGSWRIGPQFPQWIHSLKHLSTLNLSNSGIASTIPFWFWNMSIDFHLLNISHNQIHGVIPQIFSLTAYLVDMSWNEFEGPLPYMFSTARALYLSSNSFSGPLSKFLCYKMHEPRYLEVLDLGDNLMSGEMPDCWMKWKGLVVINLRYNNLSGKIPMSIGALTYLESLHLRGNSLSGEIPLSLRNCTDLSTLDLAENELVGNIPPWIGETLSNLVILSLRSNELHGQIPAEICQLNSLYILDLADNNLTGTMPQCLDNFSAMVDNKNDSIGVLLEGDASSWPFYESFVLVMKGRRDGYSSILKFVRSIDLSRNKLSGEIPVEITSLEGLRSLNLSHNLLTGRIPRDIGSMGSIESMDFSYNQLVGEIPQSIAKLTFLSHLNLSFNNLSGRIPTSTQLLGFSPSSFVGNKQLCGPPLKNCSGDGETPTTGGGGGGGEDENGHEVKWFYVSMALGFAVGFSGAFGPLLVNSQWRFVYFRFLDRLWDKIRC